MRRDRRRIGWAGGLGVLGFLLLVGPPARAQEECATCHEDVAKAFGKSPHGRSFAFDKDHPGDCTSCHGKGEEHINTSGEARILNPRKAAPADSNAACLSCHENSKRRTHWQGSPHEAAGLKCASCHGVHGAPHAKAGAAGVTPVTARCLECHSAQRKSLHQRSSHPLRDGKMECTACHEPHGTPGEKLLVADSVNDTCFACHQEKRGPFVWEHSPVREDCLTCHAAHGSNHPRLLQARTTQLCQACHQQGRHQTLAGLPTALWTTNKQCVNCHTQIHGSNHPSGPLFQR